MTLSCHESPQVSYFDDVSAWDELTGGAPLGLRLTCLTEEWEELWDVLYGDRDRAHVAKEITDVVWTALALAKGFGIDFDLVWPEVARSNFAKVGPNGEIHRREDGKIIKPPGWTPPDVSAVLEGAQ